VIQSVTIGTSPLQSMSEAVRVVQPEQIAL